MRISAFKHCCAKTNMQQSKRVIFIFSCKYIASANASPYWASNRAIWTHHASLNERIQLSLKLLGMKHKCLIHWRQDMENCACHVSILSSWTRWTSPRCAPPDARVSAGGTQRGDAPQDKPLVSCLIAEWGWGGPCEYCFSLTSSSSASEEAHACWADLISWQKWAPRCLLVPLLYLTYFMWSYLTIELI